MEKTKHINFPTSRMIGHALIVLSLISFPVANHLFFGQKYSEYLPYAYGICLLGYTILVVTSVLRSNHNRSVSHTVDFSDLEIATGYIVTHIGEVLVHFYHPDVEKPDYTETWLNIPFVEFESYGKDLVDNRPFIVREESDDVTDGDRKSNLPICLDKLSRERVARLATEKKAQKGWFTKLILSPFGG